MSEQQSATMHAENSGEHSPHAASLESPVARLGQKLKQALLAVKSGNRELTEEILREQIGLEGELNSALENLAEQFFTAKYFPELAVVQELICLLWPDDHGAWARLALARSMTGRLPEALSAQVRALELKPDSCEYQIKLAKFQIMLGNHDSAREILDAASLKADEDQANTIGELLRHPSLIQEPGVQDLNRRGREFSDRGELEKAKECFVHSLADNPCQPKIHDALLEVLIKSQRKNIRRTAEEHEYKVPTFFNRAKETNPGREGFLKYVPEELVGRKTGLNILLVSDFEIAGNQVRIMKHLNRHTTHKARNLILNRDYLNYGEDLILDTPEARDEAARLVEEADFFHFSRMIPDVPGVDWRTRLNPKNCMVDYFGGDIKFNKKNVVEFHRRTGIFGLNKYDHGQYQGAEFLMYHFPTMYDAEGLDHWEPDLGFYDRDEVVIGHAPTDPRKKCTQYLLPVLERVNRNTRQKIKVDLISGVSHGEAMARKAGCDIFIDLVRTPDNKLSGCPGQNSHESLAMGKVTICSLDNFFLSFYPDAPIFSADMDELEELLLNILNNREAVARKMENAGQWLRQFASREIVRKYLHIYQYVITGNKFVNSFDDFFLEIDPDEGCHILS